MMIVRSDNSTLQVTLPWPSDPGFVLKRVAEGRDCIWLDSSAAATQFSHAADVCGWLAARPLGVLEQAPGGVARLSLSGRETAVDDNAWQLWRTVHDRLTLALKSNPDNGRAGCESPAGWYGYVGYEMGRRLERVRGPRREAALPELRMMLFDVVLRLEPRPRRAVLMHDARIRRALELPALNFEEESARWLRAGLAADLAAAKVSDAQPPVGVRPRQSRAQYLDGVRRVLEYIAAGDIYQANFTQCFEVCGVDDPWATYARLRSANPAAYAAWIAWDDAAVLSASPELFLRVRGREVTTRPIKGTRPRSDDASQDAVQRADLLASDKEAAELAMIVDLHRNDLGRTCRPGTVRVVASRELEAHPTVWHTVAEVRGELAEGCDALDALRMAFPAGSISGAPKLRAMEVLAELEPVARGVFTGAIGRLCMDGSLDMNVAIRTLQLRGGSGTLHAGGGIVADSNPEEEYLETLAKIRGVLAGLRTTIVESDWKR